MSSSPSGSDLLPCDTSVSVTDASGVGEARRAASNLAHRLGFGETGCGRVSLVVTEAAGNLVKHAGGGAILLRCLRRGGIDGLEILALDQGPGMADPAACLRDGFSTAGSPGTGLGAISRNADFFDLYSLREGGTALLARLWAEPVPPSAAGPLEVAAVHLPKPGEEACGDGWAVEARPGGCAILVADGLGHGLLAAEAAQEGVRIFRQRQQLGPAELLREMHLVLRSTRGAAVAVCELNFADEALRFAGVGNISGTIFSGGASRSAVSHNGTVGHELRKVQEFAYEFPRGAVLVLHSDGLGTQWRLERYPGLPTRSLGLLAGVLYRDFKRGRDDVTVLAAREADGGSGA